MFAERRSADVEAAVSEGDGSRRSAGRGVTLIEKGGSR